MLRPSAGLAAALVAIDLDGTLLDSRGRVPRDAARAIRQVIAGGVTLTIATGKQYPAIAPLVRRFDLRGPQITCDGAVVVSAAGAALRSRLLSRRLVAEAMAHARQLHATALVCCEGEVFVAEENEDTDYTLTFGDPRPRVVRDLGIVLKRRPSHLLIVCHSQRNRYAGIHRSFKERFQDRLEARRSAPYFIDLVAHGVSKGEALAWVARRSRISKAEIVAIGDGENDISMFEEAGTSIAMATASATVRRLASFVVRASSEGGVREGLTRAGLLSGLRNGGLR